MIISKARVVQSRPLQVELSESISVYMYETANHMCFLSDTPSCRAFVFLCFGHPSLRCISTRGAQHAAAWLPTPLPPYPRARTRAHACRSAGSQISSCQTSTSCWRAGTLSAP